MLGRAATIAGAALAACVIAAQPALAARVKDIAQLAGVRKNQLIGMGLVGGLAGTGDDPKSAPYTPEAIANMLANFGFQLTPAQINVKNFAAVMVTADLPAYANDGSGIDVTLSSIGTAKSLEGGVLYQTLLKGADGKTYAVAQGPVSLGDKVGGGGGGGGRGRHLTTARIPEGATVENSVPSTILDGAGELHYNLDHPDFTTAAKLAAAVNKAQGAPIAHAADGGSIAIHVPDKFKHDLVPFIAALENLDIEPSAPAKVVINQRTGTVVMGQNVTILPVAVTHNTMTLTFGKEVAAPGEDGASANGGNVPLQVQGQPTEQQPQTATGALRQPTTAEEVALGLNKMNLAPSDVIAIFEAIDAAGALEGELEII
jgi:flagellar P-ring protein precursor FlgI